MALTDVESQLLAEPVRELDLSEYCLMTADTPVRQVIARMRELRQHCAIVVGSGTQLVGILTERDVLRRVVTDPETWDEPVEAVMTHAPQTISPDGTAGDALRMMEGGHYRNVPVINAHGVILGTVTLFSVLKYLSEHFSDAVYNLPPEPDNYAQQRDGG